MNKKSPGRWKYYKISELALKVLELRVKGKTNKQIAKELDIPESSISRTLKKFEIAYRDVKRIVEKVEDQGILRMGATDWSVEASKGIKSRMEAGYHWGPVPFGYRSIKGLLEIEPTEAEIVKHAFELRKEGMSTGEIARAIGKPKFFIREMLRNPTYKGMKINQGKLILGKHQAIVSIELWDACQPLTEGRWSGGVPHFGYKWFRGLLVKDPEKALIVEKISKMRLEGKTIHKISVAVGISHTPIQKMLKSPYVCGKKSDAKGNMVDADWELIIPYSTWLAVKGIRRKEEWDAKTAELQIKKGRETDKMIKDLLPATRMQLIHRIPLRSRSCVWTHVRKLLKKGEIEERADGSLTLLKN